MQGYTTIFHTIFSSILQRTKSHLAIAANIMPRTIQISHAGKKEPRMLNEGARAQPVSATIQAIMVNQLISRRIFTLSFLSDSAYYGPIFGGCVWIRSPVRNARFAT
jgi:hypothetical protein